ncbi:MAG TPA: tetratricopeptide repeat protein, partial [Polyangiales bacterium]|nr:tetratricopeptide repeat protein [Polyangiales bacterium]
DKLDELIRTLERAADSTTTEVAERIALQFRIARLWLEKKSAPDRAARAYEKALVLEPENLEAAEALSPIYEQAGDAKKLASVYEVRLKHIDDPEQRVVLLRETGILYEEKLRNAAQAFERVLEAFLIDIRSDVLREDVERLAAKVNGWDRAFQVFAEAIERSTHPDDANALRLHYGQALHRGGRTVEAIAQYRAVYEDRSDDSHAIGALEQLYREAGQWRELLGILQRRAELESDVEARKRLAYDTARLWHENLNDADAAIDAYRNIPVEFGETEVEAYRALDQLYEGEARFAELAQTLEHRIDIGPESHEELAALKFRLASVLHKHLEDSPRAIELYREVLTLMPEHDGALGALESLLADPKLGGEAASILVDVYEARGDFAQLTAALEVSVKFASDAEQRVALMVRMAEVRAARLGDAAGAFNAYAHAFEEAPHEGELVLRLEALAKEHKRLPELLRLLETRATKVKDPALSRQLLIKAAQLHDSQLNDVDAAVKAYSTALAEDEGDEEILEALEELYRRTERWGDLLDILRRRVGVSTDAEFQEQLLAQIAFIYDEMLSDAEQAIRVYAEILEVNPQSRT